MTKILATLAVLATAVLTLPSSADAAQSKRGAETDRAATMPTDISAHRRRYRHRHYPYHGFVPGWGYARPYYYGSYYDPNYAYPYRPGYWGGPHIFRYGPWW